MKRLRKTKKGVIPDMNENDNGLGKNENENADITAPSGINAPSALPAGDSVSDADNASISEPFSAADSDPAAEKNAPTEKVCAPAEGEPDNSPESEPDSESDKSDGAPSSEISLEEIKKASANASPAADDPEIVSQIADIGELAMVRAARIGVRDYELAAEINAAILAAGADDLMVQPVSEARAGNPRRTIEALATRIRDMIEAG